MEYHLLSLLFVDRGLIRHPAHRLRGWRVEFRPPVELKRSSHLVIVQSSRRRPGRLLVLFRDVCDRVNVQHNAEWLRFPFLRVRGWILVLRLYRRWLLVVIHWTPVQVVVRIVSVESRRSESAKGTCQLCFHTNMPLSLFL